MSIFLYILALLVLPAAPTQCFVGDLKKIPTTRQLPDGFKCTLKITRPKNSACSDAVIFGSATLPVMKHEVPCSTSTYNDDTVEHECICSGYCDDLFEENIVLSKSRSDEDLCKDTAKGMVLPLVTKLLEEEAKEEIKDETKLHITCTVSGALITMALLFYFLP